MVANRGANAEADVVADRGANAEADMVTDRCADRRAISIAYFRTEPWTDRATHPGTDVTTDE